MSDQPKYRRILLKLSGEALCAPGGAGIDAAAMAALAREVRGVTSLGVQLAVVVGAGISFAGATWLTIRTSAGPPPITWACWPRS